MPADLSREALVVGLRVKTVPEEAEADALGRDRQMRPVHHEFASQHRVSLRLTRDSLLHPPPIAGEKAFPQHKKRSRFEKSRFSGNLQIPRRFSAEFGVLRPRWEEERNT